MVHDHDRWPQQAFETGVREAIPHRYRRIDGHRREMAAVQLGRSPREKDAVSYARDLRRYRYIGPAELLDLPADVDAVDVTSVEALDGWLAGQDVDDRTEPFTYVITTDGNLRVSSRRREHVACAGGEDVLGAGEIQFDHDAHGWMVTDISNQSTGYCPDLDSWTAVAAALGHAGLRHPAGFTQPIVFRGCTMCLAVNIVRDDDFTCAVCGADLPDEWNLDNH